MGGPTCAACTNRERDEVCGRGEKTLGKDEEV